MVSRKEALKILAGIPLLGSAACASGLSGVGSAGSQGAHPAVASGTRNLLAELEIRPVINGRGTLTYLSGSLMRPEVVEAIRSTAGQYANLREVQDKVGARIAELLRCEAAMVTSGAASAMTLGTAAAITGTDVEKIELLPNLPGPKGEVIIQATHRFGYDHAVRNCGITMVEVNGPAEMEAAINERTVMALYFNAAATSSISREEFVAIGKRRGVATFIDAAADVPPVENLFRFTEMGFDLVTFSGGKAIRGPQSAGLLFGRKELIEAAKLNHSPNSNSIGRGLKVNKEEMFGMLVALESYLNTDHEKEWKGWVERTRRIAELAEAVPTVRGETHVNPGPANHFPGLRLSWDASRVGMTPVEVARALQAGEPSIEVAASEQALHVAVIMLRAEDVDVVGWRVREVLEQATEAVARPPVQRPQRRDLLT